MENIMLKLLMLILSGTLLVTLSFYGSSTTLDKKLQISGDIELTGVLQSKTVNAKDIKVQDPIYAARYAFFFVEALVARQSLLDKVESVEYEVEWANVGGAFSTYLNNKAVIIIDSEWAGKILTKYESSMPLSWIIAHELGHHALGHTKSSLGKNKEALELEADRFAGRILGSLRAYKYDAQRWMNEQYYTQINSGYPQIKERMEAISKGYNNGCKKSPSMPFGCGKMLINGDLNNPPNKMNLGVNEEQNLAAGLRSVVAQFDSLSEAQAAMKDLKERGIWNVNNE